MSKCIYKEIADNLNKQEFESYYKTHPCKQVCDYFNFDYRYLYRILHYLNIEVSSKERHSYIIKNYVCKNERNKKISISNKGRVHSPETIAKIRQSNKDSYRYHTSCTTWKKGHIPWNKGKPGIKWSEESRLKYYDTMSKNNWFQNSRVEENFYLDLKKIYSEEDIVRQYFDKERYPFRCDFYIKSEDLFIELNRFWHHGPHPFNENNPEDMKLLEEWKEKAKTRKQYKEAIKTWTIRDIKKIQKAKENNLNYQLVY